MKIIPLLTVVALQVSFIAPVKAQIVSEKYTRLLLKASYGLCMISLEKDKTPNNTALEKMENEYLRTALFGLFGEAKASTDEQMEVVKNQLVTGFSSCLYTIEKQKNGK